jgi:hypothetical protein
MKGKRNPVAQHMNEFNKPKTFRNRKKGNKEKVADSELHHPVHEPYKRDHHNLLLEADEMFPITYDEELPPWDLGEDDE